MNDKITMNRMAVIKHPAQTEIKRVLCCCSAGVLRSPTMANIIHQDHGYNTRAAGLNEGYALIYASNALLLWADQIVVAESWMVFEVEDRLKDIRSDLVPVLCLQIPDNYEWNDKDLQKMISTKYQIAINNLET